ncbi:HNH endonuclease [Aerococcus urinaeequi]|uniref:HNH endonuclease n=1 Tax=Aerococcus urinaeequi TaxID=51665 RepID=UPI003B3B96BC
MVIWKDVEGFEGLYKVSSEGVLIGTSRRGTKGGVVKQHKMKHEYMEYHLYKNCKRYHEYAHRLIAKHFIPNPDNKPFINHIDGNRANNSIKNLEWVTNEENVRHAVRTGLFDIKGENHPNVKLTDQEVSQIRDLYKHKIYNQRELGEIYGIHQTNISYIVLDKTRKAAGN